MLAARRSSARSGGRQGRGRRRPPRGRAVAPGRGRRQARRRAVPRPSWSRRSRPASSRSSPSTASAGPSSSRGAAERRGSLPFDLGALAELFTGEIAVYVRPGTPQPVGHARHPGRRRGRGARDGRGRSSGLPAPRQDEIAVRRLRRPARRLDLEGRDRRPARRRAAARPGRRASSTRAEQAGLPDETTGFGYVDLQAIAAARPRARARAPRPRCPRSDEYLEPLGSVVFWGGEAGDAQRLLALRRHRLAARR